MNLSDEYAFWERVAEQSLTGDPEAGLDEMFIATLDEPGPDSATGPQGLRLSAQVVSVQ
jgi:hypothetical protein